MDRSIQLITMVPSGALLVLLLAAARVSAEYTWTGTDWKWQNPEDTKQSGVQTSTGDDTVLEGSGDDWEDEEDEEDYNYDDEEDSFDDYSVPKQSGKVPTLDLPKQTPAKQTPAKDFGKVKQPRVDDEDLAEGSGFDDEDDEVEGSGPDSDDSFRNWGEPEVTSPPRREPPHEPFGKPPRAEEPPVLDLDDPYSPQGGDDFSFGGPERLPTTPAPTRRPYEPKPTESPGVHKEPNLPPLHRPVSFFAQPGILAAVIGGAVVGLLCAILLVMFIVYRMRKKDEGSYALDEPKRAHNANSYSKPPSREFYA